MGRRLGHSWLEYRFRDPSSPALCKKITFDPDALFNEAKKEIPQILF